MEWHDFETAAPKLAAAVRRALGDHRAAMLATVRPDGSPRISAIEPFFIRGRLVLGILPSSAKARDLERDARCELHNPITEVDNEGPEVRLRARARWIQRPELAGEDAHAWWAEVAPDRSRLVALDIIGVDRLTWDLEGGRFSSERWTPATGVRTTSGTYP